MAGEHLDVELELVLVLSVTPRRSICADVLLNEVGVEDELLVGVLVVGDL